LIHKELKVFEAGTPQEVEHQVHEFSEQNGMVPFSVSVLKSDEARNAHKYKAFVVFEEHQVDYSDLGHGKN
jgi:hypothetical protein